MQEDGGGKSRSLELTSRSRQQDFFSFFYKVLTQPR